MKTDNSSTAENHLIIKKKTIEWCKLLNKPPFPMSPQQNVLNGKEQKAPAYYESPSYYKSLEWTPYKKWHEFGDDVKEKIISKWHKDKRIEGVSTIGGFNGKHWLAWVDFDTDDFESESAMLEVIQSWIEANPILKTTPQFRTPSGGYRILIAWEAEPLNFGANNGFSLKEGAIDRMGELLTKNGGHTLLPPCIGVNEKSYQWIANAYQYPVVLESPESIGIYKVEGTKAKKGVGVVQQVVNNTKDYSNNQWRDVEYAKSYLEAIPVDYGDEYDRWIQIGMACKNAGLDCSDWDNWSRGSSKYKSGECEKKWKSFKSTGVGVGTLGKIAKDFGWQSNVGQKSQDNLPNKKIIKKGEAVSNDFSQHWEVEQVEQELFKLAEARPKKVKLSRDLKKLSQNCGWILRDLKDLYQAILEEKDKEAELEDDVLEIEEILNSNEPLPCTNILPKNLHPILKFADNLGVNPEPVLVSLEATLASLIHPETKIVGRKSSDYEEVPTLFSAIVGEPGSKKSPIINAIALKPLAVMDKEATEQYNAEFAEYERDLAEWEAAEKQHKGDKPIEPKKRQYYTGDYTPEALREISQDNPKILRLFDELAREANSRGRYTSGKGGEAQQLLESYNGYLPPINRKGKHYPSCFANQSLLGGIQPDILSNIMSKSDPTGEFARYNVASLIKKPHFWNGDSEVSLDITPLLISIYKAIDELPAMKFHLTPEAYTIFERYHNKAETKANEETKPALIYQYSKADGKILRWALLYHILEAVANGKTPSVDIGKSAIQIAGYRMRYQINQVRAILARMESTEPSKLSQIYQLALRKNQPITPRDVRRSGFVRTTNKAIEQFRQLEAMAYGQIIRTTKTYKFMANKERDVAVSGSKWQDSTASYSKDVVSSNSSVSEPQGGSKVAVDSKPDITGGMADNWQGGSTSTSNSFHQPDVAVSGSKWQDSTASSSNDVASSNSSVSEPRSGSKVAGEVKPDIAGDTADKWQSGSTSTSNSDNQDFNPQHTPQSEVFDQVKNCQSRETLAEIRFKYGSSEVGRVYNLLVKSSISDEVRQSKRIKLWLYEISLGGDLKVGKAISLKGMGDGSNNIWHIKSVESDFLWVEKYVRKRETPEVRMVQFGDVKKIH